MSEEQLKAAEAEATAEQEEEVGSGEEVSEDDLEGVNGVCPSVSKTIMVGTINFES
jgi:hypothetical protein